MTKTNRIPAEVFHPSVFILEELSAREWSFVDLAQRMPGGFLVNLLALQKYLNITPENIRLGDLAYGLAAAFGSSPEYWENLEKAWLAPERSELDDNRITDSCGDVYQDIGAKPPTLVQRLRLRAGPDYAEAAERIEELEAECEAWRRRLRGSLLALQRRLEERENEWVTAERAIDEALIPHGLTLNWNETGRYYVEPFLAEVEAHTVLPGEGKNP